jgi:hypothetical protein
VWVGFDQPQTILPRGFAAEVAVPLWTAFMKNATAHDKAEGFAPPPGITTATVCRMSGRLATDRCRDVEVDDADEGSTRRSMVYTEYFVRGTEPTTYCDLHETTGVFGKIAGLFGVGEKPPPPHFDAPPPPRGPVATASSRDDVEPATTADPRPKQEKRGFWGRLFRRGDKDKDRDEERTPRPRR